MLLNNIDNFILEMLINPNDPAQARKLALNPNYRKLDGKFDSRSQFKLQKDPVANALQRKLELRRQQILTKDVQLRNLQQRL